MKKLGQFIAVILLLVVFFAVVYKQFFLKAAFVARSSVVIENRKLREISGLTLSVQNKGRIWVHNDGARGIRLFLIDKAGNLKTEFKSDRRVLDWEDMAIGPGKKANFPYIYAGDIGDNYEKREAVRIYRFPEPVEGDSDSLEHIEEFFLKYPDGSRDAEAMFVDPVAKHLYVISKRKDPVGIYYIPLADLTDGDTLTLKKAGVIRLEGAGILKWVTAADISPDGLQILIRTYGKVFYWKRKPGETVMQALQQPSRTLYHKGEIQGESIGFSRNGKGFYTISEGRNAYLNYNTFTE